MNTPPDDIDARLARREPLFRRNTAADPLEPPAEIDRIVLARARAALRDTNSDEAPRPAFLTLRPWVMPLGLAATLVLVLAVVVRLGPDAGAPSPRTVAETDLRRDAPVREAPIAESAEPKPAVAPSRDNGANQGRIVARASREATREAEVSNTVAADMPAAVRAQASAPAPAALAMPAPPPAAALADTSADTLAKASGGAGLNLPPSQATAARSEAVDFQASPELWYRKILELRSRGQRRAAEREWRSLKERYPQFEPSPAKTGQ